MDVSLVGPGSVGRNGTGPIFIHPVRIPGDGGAPLNELPPPGSRNPLRAPVYDHAVEGVITLQSLSLDGDPVLTHVRASMVFHDHSKRPVYAEPLTTLPSRPCP